LVAAIPAGFLAYLLVMVFLTKAGNLPTMATVLVGLTLACAVLVILMPFGLLIFGGKKAVDDDDERPAKASKVKDDEEVEEIEEAAEVEEADEIEDVESDGGSDFEIGESDADIMSDSDDDISGPASSLDEIESVDFEDEDDEPPKKKKKK
jgi:hypothetical protein